MERFFPSGRTDLVLFPPRYISRQDLHHKMLKDNDEVAILSAVNFLTRIHDYFKETLSDRLKNYFREIRNLANFFSRD